MANEESNGLEKQNLSLYADVRERLLQKMKQYPTQEDWIYYQEQSVVTKVQDHIPWDARISRDKSIERACQESKWDSQYYKICIGILYRLQMGYPLSVEDVMLCRAIYMRVHKSGKDVHEVCRTLGVETIDWLGATTRLLGLEETEALPVSEERSEQMPDETKQYLEADIPAGQSATVTIRLHVQTE